MDELDSLLNESLSIVRDIAEAKAARERVKRGGQSAEDKAADAARIASWEAQHVWKPEANVARFVEQECRSCGDCQYIFTGLLQRQSHRHIKTDGSQRWVQADKQIVALPNEVMLAHTDVPFCIECSDVAGFMLKTARWESGEKVEWDGEGEGDPERSEPLATAAEAVLDTPDNSVDSSVLIEGRDYIDVRLNPAPATSVPTPTEQFASWASADAEMRLHNFNL